MADRDVTVEIRARAPEDLRVLEDLLWDQQPESSYPLRNPLPIPTTAFLHADDADAAWTATLDGRPAGHVCRTTGHPDPVVEQVCAEAHGCAVDELGWVSTLYVGRTSRGLGLGRALLDTVVAHLRAEGRRPCLEVYPAGTAALTLYTSGGWCEVMRTRPEWLRAVRGDEGPDARVLVLGAQR
jgi:GNAT superfamily N-acetyltransferase